MASSGTEVRWAGPGLGKGPQRRRWAWVEEKDAERSSECGWGEEQHFSDTSSPELLEDFLAQQHLPPLQWAPDPEQSGGSSGEATEAEDVDSPESSTLPLTWLPQQDLQLDVTEEEPDEAPGSPEAEDGPGGVSSPRLGCRAAVSWEGHGISSPVALGQGQASGWAASGQEAGGNKLPEPSEVKPSAELGSVRSWSSGTMSLGHPTDSLDSTWEGETDVPEPTAQAETRPQSPGHHLLNPDDRTEGGVTGATATEFQDFSAQAARSPQSSSAGRWKTQAPGLPGLQPLDQTWKQTKTLSKPLPSRFTGSISPPNPRPRPARKDRSLPRQEVTLAGRSSSETPKYGRGRLNYPLPDFSKVGPRVKFPKDESYHPPKSKSHNKQPQGATQPLIFKSPAEIVQEVLLSSGEAAGGPPSAHPVARVPQEFQTPEQATKLVHQLQEDYHRLLTKYAAAENTIDQLRLGAKVHLYSDPPQPSHSFHMGMAPQGTKVLSFTIPHLHSTEWWSSPPEDPQAREATGRPPAGGDQSLSSPTSVPAPAWLPESRDVATDPPCTEWTEVLASQASRLLAKVESFEGLMQMGRLSPQDQLKGFQRLKAAHRALEEEYLQACSEPHLAPHLAGSQGTPGKFDPTRELEAEIYHLGVRLEELKDHVDQTQQEPEPSRSDPALDGAPAAPLSQQPMYLPTPSGQVPTPAAQIPYPEPAAGACPLYVSVDTDAEVEMSPGGSEAEDRPPGLPALLRHKELRVEQDFHGLLERYLSVKSLPEALRVEEQEKDCTLEADGPASAPGNAQATKVFRRQYPAQAEKNPGASLQEDEEQLAPLKPPGFQTSKARDRYAPGLGEAEAARAGPDVPPHRASHQSSLTSLDGSGLSEHLPRKAPCHAGGPHPEEPWMASPETDSGFVGSETSRASPFTHTPEHRLAHISNPGTQGQGFAAPKPRDGASHPKARAPLTPRRASEPSTPRSRAQKHLSSPSSTSRQRMASSHLEHAPAAERAPPGSEFEGRKRSSQRLLPSRTFSPPRTPATATAAASLPHGPPETTPNLPLSRTERDQAIRELQAEVSRLRLRLEDSLHRPSQASPAHPESAFDRPARTRDQPADSSATWSSHCGSKSTERLSGEPEGVEQSVSSGRRRARAASVPREVPRLSLSSESELPSPRLSSEKNGTTQDSPQAAREGTRAAAGRNRRPERVSFRGQYTGQEYRVPSPKADRGGSSTASCLHCQPARTQDADSAGTRDPLGLSATDARQCPLCGRAGSTTAGDGPGSATSGAEKATARRHTPATSSPRQRSKRAGSPARPPAGLWYLAAAPPAPAPPPLAYISPVPIMPYPPATVYYAPSVPTSAPATPSRPARGHRHSIQLDLGDLEELHVALSQAVQAAESVRSTTRQMSRSLSADLRQAGLRGSCLF